MVLSSSFPSPKPPFLRCCCRSKLLIFFAQKDSTLQRRCPLLQGGPKQHKCIFVPIVCHGESVSWYSVPIYLDHPVLMSCSSSSNWRGIYSLANCPVLTRDNPPPPPPLCLPPSTSSSLELPTLLPPSVPPLPLYFFCLSLR